jgi:hypothetical protein
VTFSLDMRLGARAGFKRNERMLSLDPRYVIAFPGQWRTRTPGDRGQGSADHRCRSPRAPRHQSEEHFGQDRLRPCRSSRQRRIGAGVAHQRKGVRLSVGASEWSLAPFYRRHSMIDIEAVMADFAVRQAERQAQVVEEIQQLKAAILPRLQEAEIARVEIRFDGCGDSGAVEECVCLDAAGRRCLARMSPCWKAKQLTRRMVPFRRAALARAGSRAADLSGARTSPSWLGDQRRCLRRTRDRCG